MKYLVTGSNGLLGQKLTNLISKSDLVYGLGRGRNRNPKLSEDNYVEVDLCNLDSLKRAIDQVEPDRVIHTAAMTQVDQCELEQELCYKLNVVAVDNILEACSAENTHLTHVSTDFIFDGKSGPYKESDKPNPISYYGKTKLEAEESVESKKPNSSIIRTVLVYGIVPKMSRSNIILWVKKSLEDGKAIKVVNDQWRTPTLAEDLAQGCFLASSKKASGVFNISGAEMMTPYDIAIATSDYFGLDKNLIEEVDGSMFSQAAKRPPKTGFDISKAQMILGYKPHSFKQGLALLESQIHLL